MSMNLSFDPYTVLGLHINSSAEEIKESYKNKILEWHPDKNKSDEAAENFRIVREAWLILNDVNRKSDFDKKLRQFIVPMKTAISSEVCITEFLRSEAGVFSTHCRCGELYEVYNFALERILRVFV
eukprot:gene3897-7777_t